MKKTNLILLSFHLLGCSVYSQQFQDLNFERANLPSIPAGQFGWFVPIATAFPGWSANAPVFQNNISGGEATIDILGPTWQPEGIFQIIAGNYTAVLQAGDGIQGHIPAILEQTGQIPAFAKSILFDAAGNVDRGQMSLEFNGESLPFALLSSGPNFGEYGADVSALAGQTGLLSFIENTSDQGFFGAALLDNISFSPESTPEPATWEFILCGAGAFAWSRWTKRR